MIRVEQFSAPDSWACLAMYGDESGLEPEDAQAARAWLDSLPGPVVDVGDTEDAGAPGFTRWHDAAAFCPYAANCALYAVHIQEESNT